MFVAIRSGSMAEAGPGFPNTESRVTQSMMEHEPPPPPPHGRPRSPERELRDRAKAAKLRHSAAKARMKATRLEDRSRRLFRKATAMEQRANELDG